MEGKERTEEEREEEEGVGREGGEMWKDEKGDESERKGGRDEGRG